MSDTAKELSDWLLPTPRKLELIGGKCSIGRESRIFAGAADPRVTRAVADWLSTLASTKYPAGISLEVRPGDLPHSDGYALKVTTDGVLIIGASAAGCFHGMQTLKQLRAAVSGNSEAAGDLVSRTAIPCCIIRDWPDFTTRGLLHDVTRGKVPTLNTLKLLVDRLALLKCNQLQLYIEHAFTFAFDPEICDEQNGLTPQEVSELHRYCHERFIDLVPAVATLGHMGRILSIPKYRHLAEIEPTKEWSHLAWPERARGFTLDCANPEAWRLVERIWSEMLECFPGPFVNICGDEPWDLGAGKNAERFTATGTGPPYVAHLECTHRFCAARGRRTQFWSDVIRNHANLVSAELRESTLLHWGYDDKSDYDGVRRFVDSGVKTFVCPGTSGWKRVINAIGLAERNIATFASAGKKHGAVGLLNTDWGDHGHFNALACSWHGIALGAACAWNAEHITGGDFDQRFVRALWGIEDVKVMALLRAASRLADEHETWRLLWQPKELLVQLPPLRRQDLLEVESAAAEVIETLEQQTVDCPAIRQDFKELVIACHFTKFLVTRLRNCQGEPGYLEVLEGPQDAAQELSGCAGRFATAWLDRNKPSGLSDILTALERVESELRRS